MSFYTKFMELCEKNNKRHYSVLRELGIDSGNLGRWKRGSLPNALVLYDIAKYFGCRIEDLIDRDYLI